MTISCYTRFSLPHALLSILYFFEIPGGGARVRIRRPQWEEELQLPRQILILPPATAAAATITTGAAAATVAAVTAEITTGKLELPFFPKLTLIFFKKIPGKWGGDRLDSPPPPTLGGGAAAGTTTTTAGAGTETTTPSAAGLTTTAGPPGGGGTRNLPQLPKKRPRNAR